MIGSSRESYAALREGLDRRRHDPGLPQLAGELMAASDVIGSDQGLRSVLSDSGQPTQTRVSLIENLFGNRVSPVTVGVLREAVAARWSTPSDLSLALNGLAAEAAFLRADVQGTLDQVSAELFQAGQAIAGSADLQMALTNPAVGTPAKESLVRDVLSGRVDEVTSQVLVFALARLHGQRVDSAVDSLVNLAAEQMNRSVAEVRVARDLDPEQRRRLTEALSKLQGREVRLNVAVDPSVLGGASVRIGDQVIDGTVASRLEQARRLIGK